MVTFLITSVSIKCNKTFTETGLYFQNVIPLFIEAYCIRFD